MLDRSVFSKAYLKREKIVQHQLDSFNYFLDEGIQRIIDELPYTETSISGEDEEKGKYKLGVKFGKITVGIPKAREADGSYEDIFPSQARLRNLNYSAPIILDMQLVKKYESGELEIMRDEEKVAIGELPIMLKSNRCNLSKDVIQEKLGEDLSEQEYEDWLKNDAGEDPLDPGGYFIINGSEHVIITLEDLAPNRIFVNFEEKYGSKGVVSKVFSLNQGFRVPIRVEISKKGILEVSFPAVGRKIQFMTLIRALGLGSDEEIIKAVSDDPQIVKYVLENIEVISFHILIPR
jgi:DNA-directed RNA polymerase subunit B"